MCRWSASCSAVPVRLWTQPGVWLCHSRVWPCTILLVGTALATIPSALVKVNFPWFGSVASHFNAFSGVTWLNSELAMPRYVAFEPDVQVAVLLHNRLALAA